MARQNFQFTAITFLVWIVNVLTSYYTPPFRELQLVTMGTQPYNE